MPEPDVIPTDAELLGYEPYPDPRVPPTPVIVEGVVRTDEMPCTVNPRYKILRPTNGPEKILQANPRRKLVFAQNLSSLVVGDASEFIMLSRSKGDCDSFVGYLLVAQSAYVRLEMPWQDEMWARGINLSSGSGVITAVGAATTDCLLTVATFDWAQ